MAQVSQHKKCSISIDMNSVEALLMDKLMKYSDYYSLQWREKVNNQNKAAFCVAALFLGFVCTH